MIKECYLTYRNIIKVCDLWKGPDDTCKVINKFKFPDFEIDHKSVIHLYCEYALYLDQYLNLVPRIDINFNPNSNEPELLLSLQAAGSLVNNENSVMLDWFDKANSELNKLFHDLTTDHIRSYWNKG